MNTRTIRHIIMTLTLALFVSSTVWAHEGHAHKVMGVVTMVGPDHLMVKTKDPKSGEEKTVTITVNEKTKILKETATVKLSDLTEGQRVVVDVGDGKEPVTAKEIQLGAYEPGHTGTAHP